MSIDFDEERMEEVKKNYELWWEGKLERPILPIELVGRDSDRKPARVPLLTQANCNDLSISPKDITDAIDYDLSTRFFLGDAYPHFNMDCFGPGVVAAFCGAARLDNSTGRVWFRPAKELPIREIHLEYDPENVWYRRVKDIYAEALERWKGSVVMGLPDLGGEMDILSALRPGEKLFYDICDEPREVKRVLSEIHELWQRYYDDLVEMLTPVNGGFTDWSLTYSKKPVYILQCDFSYMISPEMQREFVLGGLADRCRRLSRSFYHLDGRGQLKHLDSILSIGELNGVQWVPGAGSPDCDQWLEVYAKIKKAGKKIQCVSGFEVFDRVVEQLGDGGGVEMANQCLPIGEMERARKFLNKYGF